jgi:hypothetical protein
VDIIAITIVIMGITAIMITAIIGIILITMGGGITMPIQAGTIITTAIGTHGIILGTTGTGGGGQVRLQAWA